MRVLKLPSKQIRHAINNNAEIQHRKEQSKSKDVKHAECGRTWLNGFYYAIDMMSASYGPQEAKSAYLMLKQITDNLNEMLKNAEYDLKDVDNSKKYYFPEKEQ